jgi:hypothetical protein
MDPAVDGRGLGPKSEPTRKDASCVGAVPGRVTLDTGVVGLLDVACMRAEGEMGLRGDSGNPSTRCTM